MIPWPVSQHTLHDCRLQLSDRRLDHASLFPFFDAQGVVHSLMLTTRDSSTVSFVDWKPCLTRKLPFLARRIDLNFGDCRDIDLDRIPNLADLWHFDPWWELRGLRHSGHPAVPRLKATNIPGFDDSLRRIWFESDLRRVALVALRETGDGATWEDALPSFSVKGFSPAMLRVAQATREANRPAPPGPRVTQGPWRLRPFWD